MTGSRGRGKRKRVQVECKGEGVKKKGEQEKRAEGVKRKGEQEKRGEWVKKKGEQVKKVHEVEKNREEVKKKLDEVEKEEEVKKQGEEVKNKGEESKVKKNGEEVEKKRDQVEKMGREAFDVQRPEDRGIVALKNLVDSQKIELEAIRAEVLTMGTHMALLKAEVEEYKNRGRGKKKMEEAEVQEIQSAEQQMVLYKAEGEERQEAQDRGIRTLLVRSEPHKQEGQVQSGVQQVAKKCHYCKQDGHLAFRCVHYDCDFAHGFVRREHRGSNVVYLDYWGQAIHMATPDGIRAELYRHLTTFYSRLLRLSRPHSVIVVGFGEPSLGTMLGM
ncbi:hypothetical protein CBR_g57351 [Chara braunii]|uniref:CCHC-type domain-containing protein n=1 Tax=Chara braunii TaxID=69332 RepID=A0A388ME44_CHABU|nr:hypothetical protein CBR_g57351 [Chara braunii]|eukprot:GBG92831.1 hypothetical protein CBR_g57351 [Chara braunii]